MKNASKSGDRRWRLLRDEGGQTLVLVALSLTVFLGVAALAVDIGWAYREKRVVQTAADAGALAAAAQMATSPPSSGSDTPANTAAKQNGLTLGSGTGQATVTANVLTPSTSGTLGYVQVSVVEHTPTFLMGILGSQFQTLNVGATAQAAYGITPSNNACFTTLSPSGAKVPNYTYAEVNGGSFTSFSGVYSDFAVTGSGKVSAPSCGIQTCGPSKSEYPDTSGNSAGAGLFTAGSGSISAKSTAAPSYGTDSSGGWQNSISPSPTIESCSGDPLAKSMPTAPTPGSCIDPSWMSQHNAGGNPETIGPGTYCNFNTENVSTLTMKPGLYIVTKTFSTNSGSTITGSGVTIYLADGVISSATDYTYVAGGATPYGVGNGTTMNISADTSGTTGTYDSNGAVNGVVIWDGNSSSTPDTFTFGGGASSTFSGAIYAPNTNMVIGNNSGNTAVSSDIIANTMLTQGSGTITNNYTPPSSSSGNSTSTPTGSNISLAD